MSLLVTCPNCGPREVEELRCAGESTKRPAEPPTQRELNDYVYFRDNVAGWAPKVLITSVPSGPARR